nr:MAG TPA: hypothetical protein [Caudoviricetes sp.]
MYKISPLLELFAQNEILGWELRILSLPLKGGSFVFLGDCLVSFPYVLFYFLKIQLSIQAPHALPCDPLIPLQNYLYILRI